MKKPIIDMHCDTLLECLMGKELRDMENSHINLLKLKEGGSLVQCFALFISSHGDQDYYGMKDFTPYQVYERMLAEFKAQMAKNSDLIKQVTTSKEIEEGLGGDKLMALLTIEDSAPIDGKIERFDEMYKEGVRLMSLTWNYENCIAFPNTSDAVAHNTLGLKPFGFEAIEKMNDLGIIIDTSHLSERGFWEVIEKSRKPFVSSHACARHLCDHSRNLTDDQLRALADKGGMVGLNFAGGFLVKDNWATTSIESVVDHMIHIKKVAGADVLGWGSDFDGIGAKLEWSGAEGMQMLVDALRPWFSEDELDKICYKNFLRVLKDNESAESWKAPAKEEAPSGPKAVKL